MSRLRDPNCLGQASASLGVIAGFCAVASGTTPVAISSGLLSIAASGISALTVRLQSNNVEASRVLERFAESYKRNWRTWSNLSENEARDAGVIECAIANFEIYFNSGDSRRFPSSELIVKQGRDAEKISKAMLEQAIQIYPEFYKERGQKEIDKQEVEFSREFFLSVIEGGLRHLLALPEFATLLQPAIQGLAVEHYQLDKETHQLVKEIRSSQLTQERFEQQLREREKEIKSEYLALLDRADARTDAQLEKRFMLEQELGAVQLQLADKDASFKAVAEQLESSKQTLDELESQVPAVQLDKVRAALDQGPEAAYQAYTTIVENASVPMAKASYEAARLAEIAIRYEDALRYFRKAATLEDQNPVYLNGAGEMTQTLGRYADAATLLGEALKIRQRVLGKEHPDTADSYNNVASNLDDQGCFDEAEPLYRKSLGICQRVLGEEHPDTATGYNNVAYNLNAQGRLREAELLFRQSLGIRQRVLGEEHPDTAASFNNIAYNLNAQGRLDEAEPLYRKGLTICQRVLGDEHPNTAASYNNVAYNLNAQGRLSEAVPLYRKCLRIRQRVLGEDHPSTSASYNNVASNLDDQGCFDEAEPLYRKSLGICQRVLGEEHPDTATGYNNVAYNLNAQGRLREAEFLFRKGLEIMRRVHGEEHPDTATSYNNVAGNLNAQGRLKEAERLYRKSLVIRQRVLGEEHPDTATSYNNVAGNLNAQGRLPEAELLFRRGLEIMRRVLGEEHPSTAISYNNVAYNLHAQERFTEAEPLYRKGLEICQRVLGEDHPTTKTMYDNFMIFLESSPSA